MRRCKGSDMMMHIHYHMRGVVALVEEDVLVFVSVLATGLVLMNLVYTQSNT